MVMQQIKFPARFSLNRSLEGQRIVIIGGTSGFGMGTAKAASAEGASVVVASSKRTNVDRALDELPTGAEGHVLDITQESAVTDFFSTVGEFDHLALSDARTLQYRSYDRRRWGKHSGLKQLVSLREASDFWG
jgi:NADPH:quinone reductase-like Zn-dependent oxidoreductase